MSEAKILQFPKTMRTYMTLLEQADADDMYGDSRMTSIGPKHGEAFTDHGRADTKSRPNDPRFADNPMTIDEFAESEIAPELDRIHQALNKAGYSDLEIRQGVELTHEGKTKIAAALGISTEEVDLYVNSLIQNLEDESNTDTDALLSDYYGGMSEGADAPIWAGPIRPIVSPIVEKKNWAFDDDDEQEDKKSAKARDKQKKDARREKDSKKKSVTERFSAEPDSLGNVTIRDQQTGKEKFIQGSQASEILDKLDGGDPDQVLAPLMEYANLNAEDDEPDSSGFADEINAEAGSYNFPWDYATKHGTGTVFYSLKNKRPDFKMVSVRTDAGDDILDTLDSGEYKNILGQAKKFIEQA
jgi:hypothetical protein